MMSWFWSQLLLLLGCGGWLRGVELRQKSSCQCPPRLLQEDDITVGDSNSKVITVITVITAVKHSECRGESRQSFKCTMMNLFLPLFLSLLSFALGSDEHVDFLVTTQSTNISNTAQHFVARITDPMVIATARAELNKMDGFQIISGTINATAVAWNPGWTYHIEPDTVFFGEVFTEVCDANVEFVEENLGDVGTDFLPNNQWCPWESRVLEELDDSDTATSEANKRNIVAPSVFWALLVSFCNVIL